MEAVRQKVRKNLAERYAWPYETPAVVSNSVQTLDNIADKIQTPTPADPAVQEPAEGNLRNLIDKELQALHYNLPLDEDQKAELISAMKGVARKFGNDMFSKMASGFQAMAKPGLDMALGYLTEREKLAVVALVQTQAAKKLKEFEEEIGSLTVDSPEVSQ
ncbi:hypothetical protein BU23DRAFT_551370 [Bimuria novae-zelandiae CBS 107.79]|uniref:Uncharacterized protein n=1 Tax=Bimuria novae-zelandiae CBS 107.79 TaxID=1447943 RepID=A0A6A5VH90_9PLEO|nr:hypothetical protein BU23DRAFT_551370 [Bimuria novae-zelandiae CBS 107.79]